MKQRRMIGIIIAVVVIVGSIGGALIINGLYQSKEVTDNEIVDDEVTVSSENLLPNIKNKSQFVKLLKDNQKSHDNAYGGRSDMMLEFSGTLVMEESAEEKSDFSGTNNQVTGVDEGDIIKTDGNYLYTVNNYGTGINIVDLNADQLTLVNQISVPADHYINQLNLAEGKLVIIAQYYEYIDQAYANEGELTDNKMAYDIWWAGNEYTKIFIYDITNPWTPELEKEYQFKGYYVSGRTIDNYLYFVTNEYMNYDWYRIFDENIDLVDENVLPGYKDCTIDEEYTLDYREVRYFPGAVEPSYMNTVAIDLKNLNDGPDFNAYLGSANNIYVSLESLYVAVAEYDYQMTDQDQWSYEINTTIYKFAINKDQIEPANSQSVPGNIVNQFSMDEHNGYFRIATTVNGMWFDETDLSTNNLYILDQNMTVVGKVEGLAEDERIYSTRFLGDKVYMVTFKDVDPLFVIDTKDPTNPVVLGFLKIPGVSTYLHPIDENHLIGFGQDAKTEGDRTYLTGFKISLFDVSDPEKPIETQNEVIGGLGTYSELLYNHKALMYSYDKSLMAFPIQISAENDYNTIFNGGVIYHIDAEGFYKLGAVTHRDAEDEQLANEDIYYYDWNNFITRFIYVEDVLYSISYSKIQARGLETLELISEVDLPVEAY